MKRLPWFEILLAVVVMSISLYAALSDPQNLSWRWFTRDDAYYYFKVAQNISEGHGSTFDGINPTNGYHPLWMLVCIPIFALARLDLILPLRLLLLVMSGLSVATALLFYRLIGRVFAPPIGALAALFWVFSFDVHGILYQQGLESGIAAFFIVLLVYRLYALEISWRQEGVSRREIGALAALAALTMFSRLDLVFLAGMVGLWIVFRGHLIRYFLPLDIAGILVVTILSFIARVGLGGYYESTDLALVMAGVALVLKIPLAYVLGLYQHHTISGARELLKRLLLFGVLGAASTGLVVLIVQRLGWVEGSFSRVIIVIDLGLTLVYFGITRGIFLGLREGGPNIREQTGKPLAYLLAHGRAWLRDGVLYYGILLGALGTYMAGNRLAFGTASPVSGQIKQWWASLPGRAYGGTSRDVLSFFGLSYRTDENAWSPVSRVFGNWAENLYRILKIEDSWRYVILLAVAAVIFYLILLTKRKRGKIAITQMSLVPLLAGAWLQVLYYNGLKYAAHKEWYWVSQLVIIVLSLSLVAGILYRLARPLPYRAIVGWSLAAYVGVTMGTAFWERIRALMPYGHWDAAAPYMDMIPLLEEHTEPGSMIGLTGGGNVGYFIHDRTVVNMDGLINSYAYFQALQARTGGEYLQSIGLDYVLANPVILAQQPYKGQFNEYLQPLGTSYGGKQLMHYGVAQDE